MCVISLLLFANGETEAQTKARICLCKAADKLWVQLNTVANNVCCLWKKV